MKMHLSPRSDFCCRPAAQRGVAVIVVLALLAIVFIYVSANARALYQLGRELKLVEQQQLRRLAQPLPSTNAVPKIATRSRPQ
jgi:hypothetical protein